ncbi:MAG: DUF3310 domain-containing protein [Paludibacteraceae bacterium]|nr:DUF3310 domain-containing protein [Paludibacteraceae bacterium]
MAEEVKQEGYEYVNHPSHYNRYPIEAVEMARRIWGDDAMEKAAQITAFFYRMRMGLKPEVTVKQDLDKEEFWLNYAKKLHDAHDVEAESPGGRNLLMD